MVPALTVPDQIFSPLLRSVAVTSASTGKAGLEKAITEQPDLIVLDVMMENMWAGYEVNQAIKFQLAV